MWQETSNDMSKAIRKEEQKRLLKERMLHILGWLIFSIVFFIALNSSSYEKKEVIFTTHSYNNEFDNEFREKINKDVNKDEDSSIIILIHIFAQAFSLIIWTISYLFSKIGCNDIMKKKLYIECGSCINKDAIYIHFMRRNRYYITVQLNNDRYTLKTRVAKCIFKSCNLGKEVLLVTTDLELYKPQSVYIKEDIYSQL